MAIPVDKDTLIDAIETTFAKLMTDLSRVPQGRARERTMEGHAAGTMMSPADLVAYLVGWNELILKWLDRDDRGEAVDFPETGHGWNQLGALAGKFYDDYRALSYPELLGRLQTAKARLVATIAARQNAELYGAPWYGKWTKGRMIQLNTASPYTNARGRIRRWLRTSGSGPE